MPTTPPPSTGRSRPAAVQRRGVERTQALLDAAETLLGEQGYPAATLKAVGDLAGIPTASVYHYFADRHQLEAELVRRHIAEIDAILGRALERSRARTLRGAINVLVDTMVDYFREHRSLIALWFIERTSTVGESARAADEAWAQQFWRFLVERDLVRPETPPLAVQLTFEAGNRLLDVAFRQSRSGDETVIDELRRMATAYLETYAQK
ncbi:TetR/AcrR family transcriptional regulator [Mycolicibacterium mucogenicum]|uniref:TetR/AcrR family transcriptional regulator n=1 Tax=Mycolicibacterium mucogenicum TaxID=56689 RepID=UPI00076AB750|nr:TetR/AcrR family transcriptional regulator [Mycolicibacterium mucogenicum]